MEKCGEWEWRTVEEVIMWKWVISQHAFLPQWGRQEPFVIRPKMASLEPTLQNEGLGRSDTHSFSHSFSLSNSHSFTCSYSLSHSSFVTVVCVSAAVSSELIRPHTRTHSKALLYKVQIRAQAQMHRSFVGCVLWSMVMAAECWQVFQSVCVCVCKKCVFSSFWDQMFPWWWGTVELGNTIKPLYHNILRNDTHYESQYLFIYFNLIIWNR